MYGGFMSEQRFLSEMFQVQPPHWGLRGDPFLWEDMKQAFAETPFPTAPMNSSWTCTASSGKKPAKT